MNKIKRLDQKNMDKTLDDILNYLKSTIFIEDQNYIQALNAVDIFFNYYGEEKAQIHNYTEPNLYLEKLYKDEFVNYNESDNTYQINLNGIEFINIGGYRNKTRKLKCKKYWNIIKIVAVSINAIILLIFAYFSFIKDQKEINKDSIKELNIEKQIENPQKKINNKNVG